MDRVLATDAEGSSSSPASASVDRRAAPAAGQWRDRARAPGGRPYKAVDFWRLKARLGLRQALGGLDYHRCVEFPYAANQLAAGPGDRVLDVGSAHLVFGLFLCAVAGAAVWVTDLSPSVWRQRAYPARLGHPEWLADGRFNVEMQDARRLPYPDGFFDGVAAVSTIEHIPDDGRAVRELARVLRPGGRLVLTVPFGRSHHEQYVAGDVYGRPSAGRPQFFQYVYDRQSVLRRLVEPSGLQLVDRSAFSELGLPLSRHVYSPRYGRALIGLRTLYPLVAHRFMVRTAVDRLGAESICGLTLARDADRVRD